MSWLEMRDFQTFKVKEVLENKKNLFECRDSKSDSGHSLLVHVAATHSGIVNGNMRFYRPDKMQEGVHTWLPQTTKDGICLRTPRPVLLAHDEKGSVLGRILEAKYVDTSWRYAHDFPVVKDFLFYQRDGKKRYNLFSAVDWITENLMPLKEYSGLGYTDLGLRITNPDAIRKVLAEEYLTVSVGFKTDSAICSVCHTDWATDGKCDHKLGQMVDGKQAFLISGVFDNQEVSFINFAADPFATTISKKVLTDSLEKMFFFGLPVDTRDNLLSSGLSMKDGLYDSDLHVTEETMPQVIDATESGLTKIHDEIKSADLTQDRALDIKTSISGWAPETDELKAEQRTLFSTINAKIAKNNWDKVPETDAVIASELSDFMEDAKKCPDCGKSMKECTCEKDAKKKPEDDPDEEESDGEIEPASNGQSGKKVSKKSAKKTKAFQSKEINDSACPDGICDWDAWEATATDEDKEYMSDVDGINQELEDEIDAAIAAGELPDSFKDAKLSSEARGKLSKDTFCGPGKSFPVPDCAHVTAARRLIGKAKLSTDTKAKVLACVSGKAKKLSCGDSSSKKDELVDDKFTKHADVLIETMLKDAEAPKETISPEDRVELADILVRVDKAYDKASAKGDSAAYQLRWLLRAMLTDWDADDEVRWALRSLKGKDHIVLTKAEADEKNEVINTLTSTKDALEAKVISLQDGRQAVLNASKKILAQQIVMHGVLTGVEVYKGMSQDQIDTKIVDLSKRAITSLKDTVQDILTGLHWVKQEDSAAKTVESDSQQMSDNARLTDETVQPTTEQLAEAEALQARDIESFERRLRYMPIPDRKRYLATMKYKDSAPANK